MNEWISEWILKGIRKFISYLLALSSFPDTSKLIQVVGRVHFLTEWLRTSAFYQLLAVAHCQILEATHGSLPHGLLQHDCLLHQDMRKIAFPLHPHLITEVSACRLWCVPQLRSKCQVLLTLRVRDLHKEWTPRGGYRGAHLRVCLPQLMIKMLVFLGLPR